MQTYSYSALTPIFPELLLILVAVMMLMEGVFKGSKSTLGLMNFSIVATLVAGWLLIRGSMGQEGTLFNDMFVYNAFTTSMKLLTLGGAILVMILTAGIFRIQEEEIGFEYPVLMVTAVTGMLLMISSANLISLYMGLELMSLSLYVLAAFDRDDLRSSEAGLKYFILGAVSSGMLLYGSSLIYGFTGTTSFSALADYFSSNQISHYNIGVTFGLVLVIVALCFKVSAVPFHMWAPDVYEGVRTPVTAFFAIAPKIAAISVFARVLADPFYLLAGQWQQIIIAISILSMVVGALAGLRQHNIKRLLAYSSIGHVGYALIGLAALSTDGIRGIVIYLSLYLLMSAGTFGCVLLMRRKNIPTENISDLAGLHSSHPRIALALAIFMFSMAGIPPLAGFFGKMYIFLAAVESGLYTLSIVGVLTSVIAAFYYLRIIKIIYLDVIERPLDPVKNFAISSVIAVTALVNVLYIAYPSPLIDWATEAASMMMTQG